MKKIELWTKILEQYKNDLETVQNHLDCYCQIFEMEEESEDCFTAAGTLEYFKNRLEDAKKDIGLSITGLNKEIERLSRAIENEKTERENSDKDRAETS